MNFIQNTMKNHWLCDKAMAPCQSSYLRFETYQMENYRDWMEKPTAYPGISDFFEASSS